jgi:hypothetical protein
MPAVTTTSRLPSRGLRDMAFDVAGEQFYRVQLGCVPGQHVHLNAGSVFCQPVPHRDPADLPADLTDQPLEVGQEPAALPSAALPSAALPNWLP